MIAWWWLLVAFGLQVALGAALHPDVREALGVILAGAVGVVVGPVVWLVARAGVGVLPMSPEALARFAWARRNNRKPAFVFWVRTRGVLILRQWQPGDDDRRRSVGLSPQWAQKVRERQADGQGK